MAIEHADLTSIHRSAYISNGNTANGDPAEDAANKVAAGKLWIDTQTSPPMLRLRNTTNTAWDRIGWNGDDTANVIAVIGGVELSDTSGVIARVRRILFPDNTITYDPNEGDLAVFTLPAAASGLTLEDVDDRVASLIVDSATVTKIYDDAAGTLSLMVTPAQSANARSDVSVTTSVLADLAETTGVVALGKSFRLIKINASAPCRIRLYATASARAADLGRAAGVAPAPGSNHGVIGDWQLDTSDKLLWICSPSAVGSNVETPVTAQIPFAIKNLSGAATSLTVTFTRLEEET